MDAWPRAVNAITLFVEDLPSARSFYEKALGLSTVFEDPHSAVFRFGETLVNLLVVDQAPELVEPAPVAPPGAGVRAVYTVHVEDVDTLCGQLTARGVELLNGPMDRPWGPRTASFRDPDGHVWEIAS